MALKIKMVVIDGEKRIPPEVMDILIRLGHHKQFCALCQKATDGGTGLYCDVGAQLIYELERQPEVEFIKD